MVLIWGFTAGHLSIRGHIATTSSIANHKEANREEDDGFEKSINDILLN
jgi:hypothetical protein